MSSIFGDKKKSFKQKLRETKRIINRSIRELDRELNRTKREKKKAENEIKRLAKQGQNAAVKNLCKDIVRMQTTEKKFIRLKAELRTFSAKMDNDQSIDQKILKNVNTSYQAVSNQIKLPELQKFLMDNLIESQQMEMKQDMINDCMDDALDADSDAEDQLYQKVLDEIGLDLGGLADSAPRMSMKAAAYEENCYESSMSMDMQSRLASLSGSSTASYRGTSYSTNASSYACASFGSIKSYSRSTNVNNTIGLSVGGSKDVNNFRECIEKNIMPSVGSITYNGILYEYYFDTKRRKHIENMNMVMDEKKDQGSKLFYPSYCYAKCRTLNCLDIKTENDDKEYEYYMSVGLNSNIKMNEFKRKHLNLIIVLDKSGSMSTQWNGKTKMQVANESVVGLLKHLTPKDRFGLITFENKAVIMHLLEFVNDINMNNLETLILNIKQSGGTNFECGYLATINEFQKLFCNDDYKLNSINNDYDNRIIFLTDARPNAGRTDEKSLFGMVQKYAENKPVDTVKWDKDEWIRNRIYTTFIGIGVDFNANLIESISKTRGCNYYSVKSTKDFMDKMDEEFEFMVTPLVFNVCLKINCEGNQLQIDKVYGSNDTKSKEIMKTGEISKIHTLFPAKRRPQKKGGGTKGGIQLIKLKKLNEESDNNNMNVELMVTFEDRNGKKYENKQIVMFKSPVLMKGDMIENDTDEKDNNYENMNFYDNTGIRKGILVCKYTELMMNWIKNTKGKTLNVNDKYKNLFSKFMIHFKDEMVKCKDNDLQKEIDLMKKLIDLKVNLQTNVSTNVSSNTTTNVTTNEDDLQKRLANLKR